jgi:hypothetical protein
MFRFPQPLKGRSLHFVSDKIVSPTAAPSASAQDDGSSFPMMMWSQPGILNETITADNQFDQSKHVQHKSNLAQRITTLGPNGESA